MTNAPTDDRKLSRRAALASLATGAASVGLGGCWTTEFYRYKLVLSVETDEGLKTGSTVVEVRHHQSMIKIGGGSGASASYVGESLYLDTGIGRKPIVALLDRKTGPTRLNRRYTWADDWDGGGCIGLLSRLADVEPRGLSTTVILERINHLARTGRLKWPLELSTSELPDLVTFADPRDPHTIELVDPDNLPATLGADIRWAKLGLGLTKEPVTTGLEKKLPWLAKLVPGQGSIVGTSFKGRLGLMHDLTKYNFRRP